MERRVSFQKIHNYKVPCGPSVLMQSEKLQEIANFQLDNPLESDHTNVAFLNKGGWLTKQVIRKL